MNKLIYNNKHKLFVWLGDFKSRQLPKKAGFDWHGQVNCYYTKSPYIAYQLYEYAKDEAEKILYRIKVNIAASKLSSAIGTSPKIRAPKNLEYLPYQKTGIAIMAHQLKNGRKAVYCADEQGSGKTIQAIGVANLLDFKKILVVCPASLRLNWARELEKWHVHNPGISIVLNGKIKIQKNTSVVISYELAKKTKNLKFDLIIVDETHYLKNHGTQRTKTVLGSVNSPGLIHGAPTIFLSGTPIPNGRPNELWPLLYQSAPDIISEMGLWSFMKYFCELWGDEYSIKTVGIKHEKELYTRLRGSGFMLRRLKKDILKQLPPKRYKMVTFPLNADTYKVIEKEKDFDSLEIIKHGVPVGTALPEIRREMGVAKTPQAVSYISDMLEGGVKKIVIFAYHQDVNELLFNQLKKYDAVKVTGKTSTINRQKYVDRFQNDDNCRVFVGNLQAAGTGFTLTAAHNVVFVEPSWVPGENDQCADRCHRIGQDHKVLIHYLVVEKSLDADILASAADKAKNIKNVLDSA
jgi:SNF2 family DNA or RNA helicase